MILKVSSNLNNSPKPRSGHRSGDNCNAIGTFHWGKSTRPASPCKHHLPQIHHRNRESRAKGWARRQVMLGAEKLCVGLAAPQPRLLLGFSPSTMSSFWAASLDTTSTHCHQVIEQLGMSDSCCPWEGPSGR